MGKIHRRLPSRCAPTRWIGAARRCLCGSVARSALGSSVHGAVVVVVPEVPGRTGWDALTAPPAVHQPSGDVGRPATAHRLMRGAVAACRGAAPHGRGVLMFFKNATTRHMVSTAAGVIMSRSSVWLPCGAGVRPACWPVLPLVLRPAVRAVLGCARTLLPTRLLYRAVVGVVLR